MPSDVGFGCQLFPDVLELFKAVNRKRLEDWNIVNLCVMLSSFGPVVS